MIDILDLKEGRLKYDNIFNLVRTYDKYESEILRLVVSGHALSMSNIYCTACLSGDHRATFFCYQLGHWISIYSIRNSAQ